MRFTRNGVTGEFAGWWKLHASDAWIRLPRLFTAANLQGGTLPLTTLRTGFILKNWNSAARAIATFDYLRVSARTCQSPGAVRIVPATVTSVALPGLTANAIYRFTVTAATDAGYGNASAPSNAVTIRAPPLEPDPPLIEVARGRPASLSSVALNGVGRAYAASLGNDGSTVQLMDVNNVPQCANSDFQTWPWWQVDLGVSSDLRRMQLYSRSDCCLNRMDQ